MPASSKLTRICPLRSPLSCVVLGMMPTKGIPLPMISYGGSSLLSTLMLLGILMNVSEQAG